VLFDTAGHEEYEQLRVQAYVNTHIFIMAFPLYVGNDIVIDSLRTKWVPEIRRHRPEVPFILLGVLTPDDKTPEESRLKLGTYMSAGSGLAKELGALKYMECHTNETVSGVQEVLQAVGLLHSIREEIGIANAMDRRLTSPWQPLRKETRNGNPGKCSGVDVVELICFEVSWCGNSSSRTGDKHLRKTHTLAYLCTG
jgi:GTPase SAR1 family protein